MERETVSGTQIRAPAAVLEQYGMPTWARLSKADGGSVLVVGTAHVGLGGAKQVRRLIQHEDPDVVGIELDYGRFLQMVPERMRPRVLVPPVLQGAPRMMPTLPQLVTLLPAQLMASVLGCINDDDSYGADMVTAASEARARGRACVLLDRPVLTTLARTRNGFLDLLAPDMSSILLASGLLSGARSIMRKAVEEHLRDEFTEMEVHLPPAMADACSAFRKTLCSVYREGSASMDQVNALRNTLPVELEACNIAYRHGGRASRLPRHLPLPLAGPCAPALRLGLSMRPRLHGASPGIEWGCPSPPCASPVPSLCLPCAPNPARGRRAVDAEQLDSFLKERDRVLAYTIRTMPGRRAVAVVGAGHAAGIVEHFNRMEGTGTMVDPEEVMATEEDEVRALLQPLPMHTAALYGPPLALLASGALAMSRIGQRSKWLAAGFGVAAVAIPALALLRIVRVAYRESAFLGEALTAGRAGGRAEEE